MIIKRTIILNAGHSLSDPGAITLYGKESDFNIKIRDAVIPELKRQGFEVIPVPDDYDLKKSISYVNEITTNINDALAISIHQNTGGSYGAEVYYYGGSNSSKEIATKFINAYCKETGLKNRGVKSDTTTRHGKLGWIRNTNVWAILPECGFIDNESDVKKLKNTKKIARGIVMGICAIYNIKYKEEEETDKGRIKEEIIKLVKLL